jgi:hypothetical protein
MKKSKWFVVVIVLVAFMAAMAAPVEAGAEKDYKVIKKAKKSKGDLNYFKILVTDNKTKKIKVKLTLPISLLDFVADHTDGDVKFDDCSIDVKKFLKQLKKDGETSLIEVYEDDETVKIWVE